MTTPSPGPDLFCAEFPGTVKVSYKGQVFCMKQSDIDAGLTPCDVGHQGNVACVKSGVPTAVKVLGAAALVGMVAWWLTRSRGYASNPTGYQDNPAWRPGGFDKLVGELQAKGYSEPRARAIAASVGRRKYGQAEMTRRSAMGKAYRKNPGLTPLEEASDVNATAAQLWAVWEAHRSKRAVAKALAYNPATPHDVLRQILENYDMADEVAANPGLIVARLYADETVASLDMMIARGTSDKDALRDLSTSSLSEVRAMVASNSSTPPDVLDELSKDPDVMVREYVAGNPKAWVKTLESLKEDFEETVCYPAIEGLRQRRKKKAS